MIGQYIFTSYISHPRIFSLYLFLSPLTLSLFLSLSIPLPLSPTHSLSCVSLYVTGTTVGYGDLAPTTLGGRALACLCAFIGKNPSHLDIILYPAFLLTAIAWAGTATLTLPYLTSFSHHFLFCPS